MSNTNLPNVSQKREPSLNCAIANRIIQKDKKKLTAHIAKESGTEEAQRKKGLDKVSCVLPHFKSHQQLLLK